MAESRSFSFTSWMGYFIIIIGYDEAENMKYWIIQNTWGPNWGEGGFFKMKRGNDEFGIESICEAGIPYIFDNIAKREILPSEFKRTDNNNTNNIITSIPSSTALLEGPTKISLFDLFK